MDNNGIFALGVTQVAVGLSAIIRVQPGQFEINKSFKINGSAGGSLEIVNCPPALTGSSAAGWGLGYLIGTSETIQLGLNTGGPQNFFLAATGATVSISILIGKSQGYSII